MNTPIINKPPYWDCQYLECKSDEEINSNEATIKINDIAKKGNVLKIRKGESVLLESNEGSGSNIAIVTKVNLGNNSICVVYYENEGQAFAKESSISISTLNIYHNEMESHIITQDRSLIHYGK